MLSLAKRIVAPLLPKSLKEAIKRSICGPVVQDDYFRSCSPATAPELAYSIFELH
jgi:hypothetical protein